MLSKPGCEQEKIIGFDAREMGGPNEERWSLEKKKIFLLRHDIQKPLSTDVWRWRPIFDIIDHDIANDVIEKHAPLDDFDGMVWMRLSTLKLCLNLLNFSYPYWIIAFTCIGDAGWLTNMKPTSIDPGWRLLGYDIATSSLTSGLSNFGYTEEKQRELGAAWKNKLNQYHLFANKEDAIEYRNVADERVPIHKPFFVYGLYLIEEH